MAIVTAAAITAAISASSPSEVTAEVCWAGVSAAARSVEQQFFDFLLFEQWQRQTKPSPDTINHKAVKVQMTMTNPIP